MPTTAITKQAAPRAYPTAWSDLTLAAADATNENHFVASGKDLIIVKNDNAGAQTIEIDGTVDAYGRTVTVTKSIAAGAFAMFGPVPSAYWANSSGQIVLDPSHVDLKIAVISLP